MPMDSTGAAVLAAVRVQIPPIPIPPGATPEMVTAYTAANQQLNDLIQQIAAALIQHIQTTAVVTVTSVSGVTTGTGVSGPGVGIPPAGGVF